MFLGVDKLGLFFVQKCLADCVAALADGDGMDAESLTYEYLPFSIELAKLLAVIDGRRDDTSGTASRGRTTGKS